MFDRFTSDLCRALDFAREAAQARRATLIGVDDLLLGVLGRECGAVRVLRELNVDVDEVRASATSQRPCAAETIPPERIPPFTDAAASVLELAMREAGSAHERTIATEHVLAAIACDPESALARLLHRDGVTLARVRETGRGLPGLDARIPSHHRHDSV
jgi:ATP-dependent Clp protease ATP-binding subunit ClpA